jgi:hypothetical protein
MYCDAFIRVLNPNFILRAIPAIKSGSFSIKDFASASGLGSIVTEELIGFLTGNQIGELQGDRIEFRLSDRIQACIVALKEGADPEDVSQLLNWKDFEALAASWLEAVGYVTRHGFRLKSPRIEIDVVGTMDAMALLIDCKHWKRSSPSTLERFAAMQIRRAQAFVAVNKQVKFAVPIILTLHAESAANAIKVPVVPVMKFGSFLNDLSGHLDDMELVSSA